MFLYVRGRRSRASAGRGFKKWPLQGIARIINGASRPRSCDLARRPLAALRSAAAVERWTWFVAGSPYYFKCLRKESEPSLNTLPLYDGVQKQSIVFFQSNATSWLSAFPLYDFAQEQVIVFLQSKPTSP